MLTFEVCWLIRGRVCLSSGIGLGMHYTKNREHVIDSMGIESHSLYRGKEWAARFRLVNAKVRIARNFGAYVGIGAGYDGLVATGAYYIFVVRDSRWELLKSIFYTIVGKIDLQIEYSANNYDGSGYLFRPSWMTGWDMKLISEKRQPKRDFSNEKTRKMSRFIINASLQKPYQSRISDTVQSHMPYIDWGKNNTKVA